MTSKLVELGNALDRESAVWVETNMPEIWDALEVSVIRGESAEDIKAYVVRWSQGERSALAVRIEQAARWLIGQKVGA